MVGRHFYRMAWRFLCILRLGLSCNASVRAQINLLESMIRVHLSNEDDCTASPMSSIDHPSCVPPVLLVALLSVQLLPSMPVGVHPQWSPVSGWEEGSTHGPKWILRW